VKETGQSITNMVRAIKY